MRHIQLDLSQLTVQPDPSRGKTVFAGPRAPRTPAQRSVIKTALELARPLDPTLGAALAVMDISESPPTVSVMPSPTVPMASRSAFAFTAAVGLTGTAGWVAGLNAEGGVYGSTTPEFGVFFTGGYVLGLWAGAGGGIEYTLIFGTPSEFAGPFFAVQASVGPTIFGGLAIGGSVLFAISPPTPAGRTTLSFMGFTVNVTGGWSELPVSVSVEWSNTWIHPLLK